MRFTNWRTGQPHKSTSSNEQNPKLKRACSLVTTGLPLDAAWAHCALLCARVIPRPRPTRWQTTSRRSAWYSKTCTLMKCRTCHAIATSMSPSATPATQSAGACRQVPRLPHKTKARCCQAPRLPRKVPRVTNGDQARHQSQPILTSATPATQSAGGCRQVQRLPHKVPRLPPTRATRASPVSEASRVPRKCSVHVAKCYACHAKRRGATGDQRHPGASPMS